MRAAFILVAGFLVVGLAPSAPALETDQFYAWGRPLEDATDVLNAKVNMEIEKALAEVNGSAKASRSTCRAAHEKIVDRFRYPIFIKILRSQRDRAALRAGLLDGTIDAICSNHSPVDDDAEQLPFAEAEVGATGVELLLPLTLKWAAEENISLLEALRRVTINPAQMLGQKVGHLSVGAHADVCIFAPDATWIVKPSALKSQGKNSPFLGYEMRGRVRYTLVEGHVAYEDHFPQ